MYRGEKGVEDSLPCQKGNLTSKFLSSRPCLSDGPELTHRNFFFLIFKFNNANGLTDSVLALGHNFHYSSVDFRGNHNSVLVEEIILKGSSEDVTSTDEVSNFKAAAGSKVPGLILVKRGDVDSSRHEDTV